METQQRSPDESRKHCQVFLRTANQPIYFDFIIEMTVELGCCCFVIHENSKFYECLSDFRPCFGLDVSTRAIVMEWAPYNKDNYKDRRRIIYISTT